MLYRWQINYQDGRVEHELTPEEPLGRGIGPLLTPDVTSIELLPEDGIQMGSQIEVDGVVYPLLLKVPLPPHKVVIPKGARPIFFRRRGAEIFPDGTQREIQLHCLGWQQTVNGKNYKNYHFIKEDGSVVITDNHQEL